MNRNLAVSLLLTLLLLPAWAARTSANLITFVRWSANRDRVMVMNEDGTGVAELFAGAKFSPINPLPSISPAGGPDGTWVSFNEYYEIYRVRPDGSEMTKVLCGTGKDIDGQDYSLLWGAEWSPDGSEMLVYLSPPWTAGYIALIPSDHVAGPGESCDQTLLRPIADPAPGDGWEFDGQAAWGSNGSQIAFFEVLGLLSEGGLTRLTVIERQGADWILGSAVPLDPAPEYPPNYYFRDLDWQRSGNLLAFVVREETDRSPRFWLAVIDSVTGAWGYLADGGDRLEGRSVSWSPDDRHLVFTDPAGNLVKWAYPAGPGEVLGSGELATWQRDPLLSACESAADCDDWNPCTMDSCDLVTDQCEHIAAPDGTDCGDGGWCESGICVEPQCGGTLPPCDDGNECTVDACVDYECLFDADAAWGLACDDLDSCTTGDACDGSGACAGTFDPGIPGCCLPKGETCSSDSECCSGQCHPIKGTCK